MAVKRRAVHGAATLRPFSVDRTVRAVEKVRERLLRATAALDGAGVPYAVAGGLAVAAWVTTARMVKTRPGRPGVAILNNPRRTGGIIEAPYSFRRDGWSAMLTVNQEPT